MGGGTSFFGGFLDGVNRRRGELHAEDRQREEEDRQGLLHILDAASKSEQLDPAAMPQLVSMMMEAHGADKKEIKGVKTAFRSLLGQGYETTGTKITGYEPGASQAMPGDESGPVVRDADPIPTADFNAKIRKPLFQSPEDVSRREASAYAQKIRMTREAEEPFKVADDERTFRREQMKAEERRKGAEARAKAQEEMLVRRYGLMATKDLEGRTQTRLVAMRAVDPSATYEEARAATAGEMNAEYGLKAESLKARIGFTKAATEAIPQRLEMERERVAIAREGNDIRWNELDLRSQTLALEEAYKTALVEMKGNTARQQKYAAEATPVMQQIRQVEAQRARLESQLSFATLSGLSGDRTGVASQVGAYADQLTSLRKQLNDITGNFTKAQAEPKLDVKPAAPTRGRGSRYVAPKVSREQLESLLK